MSGTAQQDLIEAIGRLDPQNEDHFIGDGRPSTTALGADVGRTVSAEQRDAAWQVFQNPASAVEPAQPVTSGSLVTEIHNGIRFRRVVK